MRQGHAPSWLAAKGILASVSLFGAVTGFAQVSTPTVDAVSDVAPGKIVSCLQLSRVDSTTVLDDKTIIFKMRGGTPRYYKNTLPYKCSQLGFEKAFSYKTSTNQICNVDIITVLLNFGGGLQQGSSCGLGKFVPYTPPPRVKK